MPAFVTTAAKLFEVGTKHVACFCLSCSACEQQFVRAVRETPDIAFFFLKSENMRKLPSHVVKSCSSRYFSTLVTLNHVIVRCTFGAHGYATYCVYGGECEEKGFL